MRIDEGVVTSEKVQQPIEGRGERFPTPRIRIRGYTTTRRSWREWKKL